MIDQDTLIFVENKYPDIREYKVPNVNLKPEMLAEIEKQVKEWLENTNEVMIEFYLKNKNESIVGSVQYVRSEINIKTCANCWDVWHIAESSSSPNLISHRVKSLNAHFLLKSDFKLPNEIRSMNYEGSDETTK